jgi:flagellar biosynthesis protein FlhA
VAVASLAKFKVPERITRNIGALLPMFTMALLLVILVPLPTAVMDMLLLANLALAGVVLMSVMYIEGPLEFSSFPSLLLGTTLFRLVLNTATTRLILTNGDAGHVVLTFGRFVASGSLAVAVIIFAIIVIIQFVVITKGATRIAEVAARFTLDGMPGKQMAVDADLNAGIITEDEAKRRREQITREADFYGAMDGASKFVRGDAIAGVIITIVNILGGVYVGLVNEGLQFQETLVKYTILTIGDGLISQIPAFVISVAAAMIVTRSAEKKPLGNELVAQLTSQPIALAMTAGFLGVLALTPLPKFPLLMLAGSCVGIAFLLKSARLQRVADTSALAREKTAEPPPIEKFLQPDTMELDVGYGLIKLADRKQGGDLLDRITSMRRQIAQELGLIVPPIRIRDDITLPPNEFAVKLKGMEVGRGEVLPDHLLAIDSGTVSERIGGLETKEPAFGLPAVWVLPEQRHDAQHRNYTVVECSSVISTYLTELIKQYADDLLTRQQVGRLLDNLKERSPKLIDELFPNVLKPGDVQRVLQGLLRERVPIGDLETILETMGMWAARTKDPDILVEYVRNALARTLCHLNKADDGRIHCITLDPAVEEVISRSIERGDQGAVLTMPPALQRRIVAAMRGELERATPASKGRMPVVLVPPQIRMWVRRLIESVLPQAAVLSYNEVVRGFEVESHGMVVLKDEA